MAAKRISKEGVLTRASRAFAGADAPSMDEIAVAAGVSRAALYDLFGSRGAILEALGLEQPPSWEDRIVAAAAELLAERGLNGLSFDQVAARTGASRATVYRLFPGKAALFQAIVRRYLPADEALATLETMRTRPPAEVMPALAAVLAEAGSVRIGVLRSVLFEVTGREDGTEEVAAEALRNMEVITRYLADRMAAGQLRTMHPLLAAQGFLGPLVLHVVSRPLTEDHGLIDVSLDEAVAEFTDAWLRAMAPPRRRPPRPRG